MTAGDGSTEIMQNVPKSMITQLFHNIYTWLLRTFGTSPSAALGDASPLAALLLRVVRKARRRCRALLLGRLTGFATNSCSRTHLVLLIIISQMGACGSDKSCGSIYANAEVCPDGQPVVVGSGEPPTIINFEMPTCYTLALNPTIKGTMEFYDPDADVDKWRLTIDTLGVDMLYPIQLMDNIDKSTVPALISFVGKFDDTDTYEYQAVLIDRQGNQSAPMCGSILFQ